MRKGRVFICDVFAGIIEETDEGYMFSYDLAYLENYNIPVSITMPLTDSPYCSKTLFPFFDGLIPEGWLLDIVAHNWKLNPSDRFGIMLAACKDPIGNVSISEVCDVL